MSYNYERMRGTPSPGPSLAPSLGPSPPLGRTYNELPTSRSNTPPSSNNHSYRNPTADPFASPAGSVVGSISGSQESYQNTVPSQAHNAAATLYGHKAKEAGYSDYHGPEDDDDLHNPDADTRGSIFTWRGAMNLGCLFMILVLLVVLFAGYPIISTLREKSLGSMGAYNTGGLNSTGQVPQLNQFDLIDPDTPMDAYSWTSFETGEKWDLVFSDEFEREGRTFYPGDDPYWEAVDLHYWGTNNREWYEPRNAYTRNGSLVLEFNKHATHEGLPYTGAMVQSWNQFCFTGGYIEASVSLPGDTIMPGLWPAVWTMGNLGRAGFGGSTDGLWPYTYDSCDHGTLPNQTDQNGIPALTRTDGSEWHNGSLSYLPGQRLSRCTCKSDKHHPGPKHSDGSWVGRGAPEIDMIEALVNDKRPTETAGEVSLSGQWAPFNPHYEYINDTTKYDDTAIYNTYFGAVYQQATSVLGTTDPNCYTNVTGCFSRYGFEYANGDDGYITWLSNNKKTWTIRQTAMGPNEDAMVGQRLISMEPMYIILNLGLSDQFVTPNYPGLDALLPTEMRIDYVRVYQDPAKHNVGCDPKDFPTSAYIESIKPAYYNNNITTWEGLVKVMPELAWPENSLWNDAKFDQC